MSSIPPVTVRGTALKLDPDLVVRAWKDPEFEANLPRQVRSALPANPAGGFAVANVGGHRAAMQPTGTSAAYGCTTEASCSGSSAAYGCTTNSGCQGSSAAYGCTTNDTCQGSSAAYGCTTNGGCTGSSAAYGCTTVKDCA